MAIAAPAYTDQLQALLPPGAAWSRRPDAQLTQLLAAMAEEMARLDLRVDDLTAEMDATTATELLSAWESAVGLPGDCTPLTNNLTDRRKAAASRVHARGGQTIAYFVAVAAGLGYYIEIEETRPFAIGSTAGSKLWRGLKTTAMTVGQPIGALMQWDVAAPLNWFVHALRESVRPFAIGSAVGDRLQAWGNALLECALNRDKPAHTRLYFLYDLNLVPASNTYLRAGDPAGTSLHLWTGPYTYQRSI